MDSSTQHVPAGEHDDADGVVSWRWVVGIIIGLPTFWWCVAWPIARLVGAPPTFWELGDAFAPVSGALSAAALYAVYASLKLQRHEFRLQREELELARHALREQSKELRASAEALTEQLKRMDAQRNVMVRANEIAEDQSLLDGYRLLDGARERADRLARDAVDYFGRNLPTMLPVHEGQAKCAVFRGHLDDGNRSKIGDLIASDLVTDVAALCMQKSMTAIDARDAVEDSVELVARVRAAIVRRRTPAHDAADGVT